jgi:uncharacterized membrane protein HdeD (DUF308 family)
MLKDSLFTNWIFHFISGIILIPYGIFMILFWPLLEVASFELFFGILWISHGIFVLVGFYIYRKETYSKLVLFDGSLRILIGTLALVWSGITKIILIVLIVCWLMGSGFFFCSIPMKYTKGFTLNWAYYLMGTMAVLFGLVLLFGLWSSSYSLIWIVSLYLILIGTVEMIFAMIVKGLHAD